VNILTIDTSTTSLVGIVSTAEQTEEWSVIEERGADPRHHAETLAPMVASVLSAASCEKPDLIVAGTGPAAFTGLRAGLMTARTLARAWNVDLVGVSSLEVVGRVALDATEAEAVLALGDARRREVYALIAAARGRDDVDVVAGPVVTAPAEIATTLSTDLPTVCAAVPGLVAGPLDLPAGAQAVDVTASAMARLALARVVRRDAGESVELDTEPQYLRRPDIHGQ